MQTRRFPLLATAMILSLAASFATQAQEEPAELVQARTNFEKEVDFASRPIRDRYLSRLDALKRNLGSRGEARAALAVQEEIDRVKAMSVDRSDVSRFAGAWRITWQAGNTQKWVIRTDGSVIWNDNNGVAAQPVKGRITAQKPGFVLEFEAYTDRLWLVSLSGNSLVVQFFEPKNSFPNGPPKDRGTGALIGKN
ncbi:MAG: hypothetical protein QOE70_1004 [Chthoniobacter sp.]|nr:hypothetical protein [Chthoniobacter sp.]